MLGKKYCDVEVSRRYANFPYVVLSMGLNTLCIGLSMLAECFIFPRPPKLFIKSFLERFGWNSIKPFLFANLLTFVVNKMFSTDLITDELLSFSIMILYMNVLSILTFFDLSCVYKIFGGFGKKSKMLKKKPN